MRVLNKGTIPAVCAVALVALISVWHAPKAYSSSAIAEAVRANDVAQSRELIEAGADVNFAEADGTTPLLWAVYKSSMETVQLLLDAGAEPNISNSLDISPLMQASRYGNAEMISALIASGASFEFAEQGLESTLMAAARAGSVDAVKVLLDAGVDPDKTEPIENQTALMWATAEGHLDVVRSLLNAGANPNAQARISELTKRKNADFPSGGFAALHWAARNGDEAMIRLLLDKGADINARNGDTSTPMMLAIVNDRFDIAALLLDMDADPNDGSLYFITEMRDATSDWRARDGTVFRADHPNELGALDLTRLLLEAGADPDKPFIGQMHNTSMCCDIKSNETPFYRAAKAADVAGIEMMLAYDADPNWKPASETRYVGIDEDEEIASRTALMAAITGGKGVGVAGGPNDLRYGPPPFREEGLRNPAEAVKLLLEAGADVSIPGPDDVTALHIAAEAGELDIVYALVNEGASLDAKNKDDKTPFELVENMPPKTGTPGFFFQEPQAQPIEIAAALKQLADEVRTQ
jgi:uncharacterized protein